MKAFVPALVLQCSEFPFGRRTPPSAASLSSAVNTWRAPATAWPAAKPSLAVWRWKRRSAPSIPPTSRRTKTGIGDYSFEDFDNAVRKGVAKNSSTLPRQCRTRRSRW